MCDLANEIRLCTCGDTCSLYPYRFGKRPDIKPALTPIKAIKAKCYDCSGFNKALNYCWGEHKFFLNYHPCLKKVETSCPSTPSCDILSEAPFSSFRRLLLIKPESFGYKQYRLIIRHQCCELIKCFGVFKIISLKAGLTILAVVFSFPNTKYYASMVTH